MPALVVYTHDIQSPEFKALIAFLTWQQAPYRVIESADQVYPVLKGKRLPVILWGEIRIDGFSRELFSTFNEEGLFLA